MRRTFRLILPEEFDAYMNMALEEAIYEAVRDGKSPPTIRLFSWKPSAVSIGYFQGIRNEVNLDEVHRRGYQVVRRITGGGAVFHDNEGETTYSIIAGEDLFPKDITKSYEQICGILISALERLGIKATFKPINDILVDGRKISGSAQTRRMGVLVQHGTLLYSVDQDTLFGLLNGDADEKTRLTRSKRKVVTSVTEHSDATKDDMIDALVKAFSSAYTVGKGDYTKEELLRAGELSRDKYSTDAWNFQR